MMRYKRLLVIVAFSFCAFAYTSCQDDNRREADEVELGNFDDEEAEEGVAAGEGTLAPSLQEEKDSALSGVIEQNEDLSTFSEGMTRAGLSDDFTRGEGPYTIFAPSNIAYDELSQAERNQFENVDNIDRTGAGMHYLVVRGKLTAEKLKQEISNANGSYELQSLQGESLTASLQDGSLVLTDASGNRAKVERSDISASNGVVHVVNRVLQPKDITRNDTPNRTWNERNDQLNLEEGDENSAEKPE